MADRRPSPTVRRRRLAADPLLALVLLAVLAFLLLSGPAPYLTERQALAGTQALHLYGPGQVLARAEHEGRTAYLLRDGDCYALCRLPRPRGLLRSAGLLEAVTNDPALPLVPLLCQDYLLVLSNEPSAARVELVYYVHSGSDAGFRVLTQEAPAADNCWLFFCPVGQGIRTIASDGFLLRAYDAAGTLLCETAVPDAWTDLWGLTVPEAR